MKGEATMKTYRQTSWHTWIAMGDVVLAGLFGLFIFVLLNVVSLGLLVTLATVGVLFLIFGLAHYFVWGRVMTSPTTRLDQSAPKDRPATSGLFVFELNENERLELLRLLEESLPPKDALSGEPIVSKETRDSRKLSLRHNLVDKLRMFGA